MSKKSEDFDFLAEFGPKEASGSFITKKRKNVIFTVSAILLTVSSLVLLLYFLSDRDVISPQTFTQETEEEPLVYHEDELRGVYIATVHNLHFPSQNTLDEAGLKKELDDLVSVCKTTGLDTIYFQARPSGDALYRSKLFPTSRYLVSEEGNDLIFDPLEYLVEKAAEEGLDVVAWVNPYRVTAFSSSSKEEALASLSEENPARKNPKLCVFYGGKLYYDPALPEVQNLILDGVRELCEGYAIKGVLFDDYFYPYPVEGESFDDSLSYKTYGNGKNLSDWRRENVNHLVKNTYETVKFVSKELTFGVSPFGIWQNKSSHPNGSDTKGMEAYSAIYCDALRWIQGEYIDYISPQIYWEGDDPAASFDVLSHWWNEQVKGTKVKLYITHAAYRVSEFEDGAAEIRRQISNSRWLSSSYGNILYGWKEIQSNSDGLCDLLKEVYASQKEEDLFVDEENILEVFP